MKFFIDTANLRELEDGLSRGFVSGVTTNPSILAKEPKCDFREHVKQMIGVIKKHDRPIPLSVEVFTVNPEEMVRQAESFAETFDYENLYIKVPIGWNELKVITELKKRNLKVNCTACMSYNQALMAANAGADYVSLFYGRIRDTGFDAFSVVEEFHKTLTKWRSSSQIIVGSIRHIHDINDAVRAGADIITIPPQFFPSMVKHPKTDEAVHQFMTDFERWLT